MPYISREERNKLDLLINDLGNKINTEGQFNYTLFRLMRDFIGRRGGRYTNINEAYGAVICCMLEHYRRDVAPYEDKAIEKNGDI